MKDPLTSDELEKKFDVFFNASPFAKDGPLIRAAMWGSYLAGAGAEREHTVQIMKEIHEKRS